MTAAYRDDDRGALEISRDVGNGTAGALTAVRAALQTIAERDGEIRAWTHVLAPESLQALPEPDPHGPLAGVPIGVKDIIHVAAMPTRCGSGASENVAQPFDAACVALLRRAGAVPVGKTVTAEFAYVTPGPTRNPSGLAHTPGGSSSGSAAAVAAGMVPIALGTQTGGSMIRPAAFCGVVGFKPTFGLVSREGMRLTCESLDVIGWYASSVADIARVADVLLPQSAPTSERAGMPAQLAFLDGNPGHVLEPDAQAALDDACARLRDRGARLEAADMSDDMAAGLLDTHSTIMHYEFARNLLPVVAARREQLSRPLVETVEKGLKVSGEDYLGARARQQLWRAGWSAVCGDRQLLLTSSALGPAPKGLQSTGNSAFNKAWSLLGWPCIHLPTGYSPEGLPVGIQLVGQPGEDRRLIALAAYLHPLLDRRA